MMISEYAGFKVGDFVYYNSKKWEVIGFRREDAILYTLRGGTQTIYCVKESDLRLWKETTFKSCVAGIDADTGYCIVTKIPHLSNIKCIGKSAMGDDIFIADLNTGRQVILYGTKGDDI